MRKNRKSNYATHPLTPSLAKRRGKRSHPLIPSFAERRGKRNHPSF